MHQSPSDARAMRSRAALIESGMRLLVQNQDAKLSDIAETAGVGRATLYRQFKTREQLIGAITEMCIRRFDNATEAIEAKANTYLEAIKCLFEAAVPLQKELSFLMKLDVLVSDSKELIAFNRQYRSELQALLKNCQAEKSIDPGLPLEWLVSFIDGLWYALWQSTSEGAISQQQAAILAFESFCFGVARSE